MFSFKKVFVLLAALALLLVACVDSAEQIRETADAAVAQAEQAAAEVEATAEAAAAEAEQAAAEIKATADAAAAEADQAVAEAEQAAAEAEQAAADVEATAEAVAAEAEAAAAEEEMGPILIGGIHPLTGGLAADGIQMDNAIQMAIAELNAAGGVLDGVEFEYLSSDSTGAADVGQTEAERLIGEGAAALICCFQSAVTSNVAAIAEREGVPLVIDVAVNDDILDQGHTYTFRLQPNATSMGVNGAQFLAELADNAGEEISTVVYLYEGTTGFGDSVRAAFVEEAGTLGIEVLEEVGYAPFEVTDLTTEMTRINSLAPDALVVTGYYNDGLLAARNAEEVGLDVKVVYGIAQGTYDQP